MLTQILQAFRHGFLFSYLTRMRGIALGRREFVDLDTQGFDGILPQNQRALLDELNHGYLFAQLAREKALGDHGVDAAHDVNHLSYTEACGDTAQSIGIELG